MFLTVCPNTALDKILFIDEWIAGTPMRTDRIVNCVGGKGLNSAVVLSHLGVETVSIAFFAGKIGKELVEIVEEYGITVDAVWAGGTTRVAHVIADKKRNEHSHVIAGKTMVNDAQKAEFVSIFKKRIHDADYVIFAGSIPPSMNQDFYNELIAIAKGAGVPTLVDAQKEVMQEAIKAKPGIVKMNWEEFRWTFDQRSTTIEDLVKEATAFYSEKELDNLVITMSKEGILAVTREGIFLAKAPLQKPVNAAGAGDAVSSTLAFRLSKGDDWLTAMHWASAVSAASVLTERTGDVNLDDVEKIRPLVTVEKIG